MDQRAHHTVAFLVSQRHLRAAQPGFAWRRDFDAEMCQRLIRGCFESEDYAEGRRAFMEKRKPVFAGK